MYATYIKESRTVTLYDDNDKPFIQVKLNPSLKNKFKSICLEYINNIFKHMSKKEKDIFKEAILSFFKNNDFNSIYRIINVTISASKKFLDKYIEDKNFSWRKPSKKHKVSFTEDEYYRLTLYAITLKLLSLFIFNADRDNYNYKKILRITINKILTREVIDKIIEFIRFNIIQSASSREHLWLFLELSAKLTPEIYIIDAANFLLVHMFTFMTITDNIFGYIAAYVNQNNYYIYTDAYSRKEKTEDITKLRYMYEYNLLEKHVVHCTIEDVIYPLAYTDFESRVINKRKYFKKTPTLFLKLNIKPFNLEQKTRLPNFVLRYISIPIMNKLFNVSHYYIISNKYLKYVEYYTSVILENELGISYIAKLMRSTPVDELSKEEIKRNKLMKRYIDGFLRIAGDYKNMLVSKGYVGNMFNDIKSFRYYDPVYNDIYTINADLFMSDVISLFELYFSGELENKFEKIRKNKFLIESLGDVR